MQPNIVFSLVFSLFFSTQLEEHIIKIINSLKVAKNFTNFFCPLYNRVYAEDGSARIMISLFHGIDS